jgi:hypothetical protein
VAGDLTPGRPTKPPSVLLADYLADVEARMPGRGRGRRFALMELADGLDDAVAHYRVLGMNPDTAAARAVRDCGPPSVVAAEFTTVLATGQARRIALALLLTGPLIGLLWLMTLAPGQGPQALLLRVPLLVVLVVVAVAAGVLTMAATGPAIRWLPELGRAPRRATATACAAAAVSDIAVITFAIWSALEEPSDVRWMPGLIAVAASLLRFTLTQRIALRDLTPFAAAS